MQMVQTNDNRREIMRSNEKKLSDGHRERGRSKGKGVSHAKSGA